MERKVLERTQELQLANENLIRKNKEIEDALYKGQKIERKRVASELHDTLGGYLAAMRFGLMGFDETSLPENEVSILLKVKKNKYDVKYPDFRFLFYDFRRAVNCFVTIFVQMIVMKYKYIYIYSLAEGYSNSIY